MTNPNGGIIKFKFNLKMSSPINEEHFLECEKWRAIFFKMGLIGEYKTTKVGFGNLSKRLIPKEEAFIITGAQTGGYANLTGMQYTKVIKCQLAKLSIEAVGPIAPDSESLSHYAIYNSHEGINSIFHIHSINLWNYMIKNKLEYTAQGIEQHTPEFQEAAKTCIGNKPSGIFAIAETEGSIIAFGENPEAAGKIILEALKESRK